MVKLSSGLYGQYFPSIAHLLSSVFTRMEHLAQAGFHGGQCRKSTRCTRELNCSHRVQGNCESKIARFLDAFFLEAVTGFSERQLGIKLQMQLNFKIKPKPKQ